MSRLTITLPDELHRALKEAAARRDRKLSELVAESLVHYGIKPREEAAAIVERARRRSSLGEDEALEIAVEETGRHRRSRRRRSKGGKQRKKGA